MLKYSPTVGLVLLFSSLDLSSTLECFQCKEGATRHQFSLDTRDATLRPCAANLNESNTWVCDMPNPTCLFLTIRDTDGKTTTLRECADSNYDCSFQYPGFTNIECFTCDTDLCNTDSGNDPDPPNNFTCPALTLDINLNINLNINNNP